ncbi:hypothetical protein AB4564_01070 [Vibrio sp. 10N.222.51.E8]|uniref:VWFA domain-containing protein n=1 Tax=Vibrio cyclitrophicus TaxID=47951 RepID=A0A7Z1S0V4_9VIBR|nr:hypothetical protein [Vibrio cyclitrophicus]PMP28123.1 hypothetical protein BCS90_19980 [Vibrio cyclitrophicus]
MASIQEVQNTMRVITDIHARFDVNIYFDRRTCYTNGRDIYINAGDPSDEVWSRLVEAKITHEAGGHLRFSDFSVFEKHLKGKSSTFLSINNIIEDCRVETACMKEFSGAYWVFQKMTYDLLEEGYFQEPIISNGPAGLLFAWLLYSGRGIAIEGQSHLKKLGDDARHLLMKLGTPNSPIFDEIEKRMINWGKLPSTVAAIDETIEVMLLLKRLSKEQPQPPKQQQSANQNSESDDDSDGQGSGSDSDDNSEGQGSGSDSDDDSDGQGSGSDADDDSDGQGSGSDSDDDSDGQDSGSAGQGASQGSSTRNPLSDEDFQRLGEALADLHELIDQAINKHASVNPASYEDICNYNVTPELNGRMLSMPIQSSINSGARAIKRIIESQMWAKEAVPIMYDESGSDFDCDLLAGVTAGNSRIFYTEDIVETHKSSFVIAIDISGSMAVPVTNEFGDRTGYCRLDIAQKAALSVAAALEELDVPVSVLYFNTMAYVGKSFNEPLMQCYPRIGIDSSDGTETNKAVLAARQEFTKLDLASRKQLLVVTDGCPADTHAVESQVEQCKAEGIDVASINICESRYGGIPNYQVIRDADDLPAVLDDMIQQNLLSSIEIS